MSGRGARRVDEATERAVEWVLRLTSGRATDQDHRAFEQWLAQHPGHARAWAEVDGLMARPLARLRDAASAAPALTQAARTALLQHGARRRKLLKLAVLAPGAALGALAVDRYVPLSGLGATYATHTAERRRYALDDGSELTLDARSAADVRYDARQRLIVLRAGGLHVAASADARPLRIRTRHGDIEAGATGLVASLAVTLYETYATVSAIEHALTLMPGHGRPLALPGHGTAAFDDTAAWLRADDAQASWRRGMLSVKDASLAEVVARLRAYQPGVIRLSSDAARLRVFGVFPLDDTRRALHTLEETLPLRIRRYGSWLTLVDLA